REASAGPLRPRAFVLDAIAVVIVAAQAARLDHRRPALHDQRDGAEPHRLADPDLVQELRRNLLLAHPRAVRAAEIFDAKWRIEMQDRVIARDRRIVDAHVAVPRSPDRDRATARDVLGRVDSLADDLEQ